MSSTVSLARKQQIGAKIGEVLRAHFQASFPGTDLGYLQGVIAGLVYMESSFNSKAFVSSGSMDRSFTKSTAFSLVVNSGDPVKYANAVRAATGVYGLMQVRGSYLVRGGSTSGVGEIERIRPDLALTLCVAPGDSVEDKLLGDSNIENALLAGITILEGKYKAVPSIMKRDPSGGYVYSKAGLRFPSRIAAAVGSYLGLQGADRFGTSAVSYATSIVGGESFRIANSYFPGSKYPTVLADADTRSAQDKKAGPGTSSSVSDRTLPPGC